MELEVKILDINEKEFVSKIEKLGAKFKSDNKQILYTYDLQSIYGRFLDLLILINLAIHVNVVYRGDKFKASKIYMDKIKKLNNVSLFYNSEVKDIKLDDDKISEITIFNKLDNKFLDIKTDGLFIAIGRDPNNELFKNQITLTKEGYIDADETTKTNIDGVYAVGDIRSKPLRQIITACSDGAVAVKFIEDYLSINF